MHLRHVTSAGAWDQPVLRHTWSRGISGLRWRSIREGWSCTSAQIKMPDCFRAQATSSEQCQCLAVSRRNAVHRAIDMGCNVCTHRGTAQQLSQLSLSLRSFTHRITLFVVGLIAWQDATKAVRLRIVVQRINVDQLWIFGIIEPADRVKHVQ
jgi:hypothetical protein